MTASEHVLRRLAAAIRSASLYAPAHPVVKRGLEELLTACRQVLARNERLTIGCLEDEVIIDGERSFEANVMLKGFTRLMRDHGAETLTLRRGITGDELAALVTELGTTSDTPLDARLEQRGVTHATSGRLVLDSTPPTPVAVALAKRSYDQAVTDSRALWGAAAVGEAPDPRAARSLVDSLANLVVQDWTALMALTSVARYDDYTFNHMVNVSVLSMALARSLDIRGPLLREFGVSALMHDIGKAKIPAEVLTKPGKLTDEEFAIIKRHVIDGAHILRKTPEMPPLSPIVAFEHHLKQDLSGYPEGIGHRTLNLATMIVSIADVYDALRTNRAYRKAMPSDRVRAIMNQQDSPAFEPVLLRRFVNLVGLFPPGTLVRLDTDEIAVVVREHPSDPFRPQVKIVLDAAGQRLEEPMLVDTWKQADETGREAVEAIDPRAVGIEPLAHL